MKVLLDLGDEPGEGLLLVAALVGRRDGRVMHSRTLPALSVGNAVHELDHLSRALRRAMGQQAPDVVVTVVGSALTVEPVEAVEAAHQGSTS